MEEKDDQRIARAIDEARRGAADAMREETDHLLELLATAFRDRRWGTFYASFPEPMIAARRLTDLAALIVPHLVKAAEGPWMAARLVQVVGELSLAAARGERTSAERDLAEARQQVARLERLIGWKADSMRLAVHELRRPLTLLGGYVSLLEGGDLGELPEQVRDSLAQLVVCNREMSRLVTLLTLAAELEDEAPILQPEPCSLRVLLQDAIASTAPQAAARNIRVHRRVRQELDIVADREHLRIALVNLLSNAFKYAPDGSHVLVTAKHRAPDVELSVTDQGPGLSRGDAARVFERYYRSSRDSGDRASGLGLGLYLVRRIAELHGGRVGVDTTPGRGATFTIRLPSSRPEDARL